MVEFSVSFTHFFCTYLLAKNQLREVNQGHLADSPVDIALINLQGRVNALRPHLVYIYKCLGTVNFSASRYTSDCNMNTLDVASIP